VKENYKKCTGCREEKLLNEFYFSNKEKGSYRAQCKKCICRDTSDRKDRIKQHNKRNKKPLVGEDRCRVCGCIKQISEFKTSVRAKKGYECICRECYNLENKESYWENIDESRKRGRESNTRRRSDPEVREENKERLKEFHIKNPDYRRNYVANRAKSDVGFVLGRRLRNRINSVIKNNQKAGSAVKDLGCSVGDLKKHLEDQFYHRKTGEAMTWENYGVYGWHIDHIIPLAKFDLSDREQFLKVCHFTNLQPLWAEDNYKKGSK